MSYIEKNLSFGERILKIAKIHWCIYIFPLVLFLLGALLHSVLLLIGGLITLIKAFIIVQTTELAITNKRVIAKHGFIIRHSVELNLSKIEGLIIDQGIMGRIFNYGTVVINGTGGDKAPFKYIAKPMDLRQAVHREVERVQEL